MGAYEGLTRQEQADAHRLSFEAKCKSAQMSREAVANGELVGAPPGLASAKAMGASVVGPELPADRMEALVDIVRAKTPAGKLMAIEAGIRAGHVTLAEALEWMGGQ